MNKNNDTIVCSIWLIGAFGLIITSAVMAIKGVQGWGWFLFVGTLLAGSFSYGDNQQKQKDDTGK